MAEYLTSPPSCWKSAGITPVDNRILGDRERNLGQNKCAAAERRRALRPGHFGSVGSRNGGHRSNNWSHVRGPAVCPALMCYLLLLVGSAHADTVKDVLDTARADYASAVETTQRDLTAAFDQQVKALSQTGDLDGVEELVTERKAFLSAQTLPTASSMRTATAKYQEATNSSELRLKTAYESALSDYTKAGRFEDAEEIKRAISERFGASSAGQPTTEPTIGTVSGDPILDALEKSKQEFIATAASAHAELLAVIDGKAKAAAAQGDLDTYKSFVGLLERVKAEVIVPGEVKDTAIRSANAKFVRVSEVAYDKLRVAYQTAIRDYTKAQRIDEAETIQAELRDGGWFASYSGQPASINLLDQIDLARDTLRKGWQFSDGVLEPTAWDNEHGPSLKIPYSAKGSYELRFQLTLRPVDRGSQELYVHLPVGTKWAQLIIATVEQRLYYIGSEQGLRSGNLQLPVNDWIDVDARVTLLPDDKCRISIAFDGKESISWEGAVSDLVTRSDRNLEDDSWFGLSTKTATVREMKLFSPTIAMK